MSSLDDAIARVERELPGWWWSVGNCKVSADATLAVDAGCGDDVLLTDEALAFDVRFDRGFRLDLRHGVATYTPADALLALLSEAKTVRQAYLDKARAK